MAHSDTTFRKYKPDQAKTYAAGRGSYPDSFFRIIFDHHAKTNGEFGLVLDVGCGPGNSTRSLAQEFDQAIGVDPGVEMINTAKSLGGKTHNEKDIRYEVCAAEACDELDGVEPGSVDMLTAAMAAHWLDMDVFWPKAAKVLKPGGTIAFWTCSSLYCHPSTPNAAEVQRIASQLEDGYLAPYELAGNRLSRQMYDNLKLPWQISPPVNNFSQSSFVKHDFNRDGVVPEGEDFFGGSDESTLEEMENSLNTASMVTRWREANPELAGTEQDCVKRTIRDWRVALGGKESMVMGSAVTILLFKKNA